MQYVNYFWPSEGLRVVPKWIRDIELQEHWCSTFPKGPWIDNLLWSSTSSACPSRRLKCGKWEAPSIPARLRRPALLDVWEHFRHEAIESLQTEKFTCIIQTSPSSDAHSSSEDASRLESAQKRLKKPHNQTLTPGKFVELHLQRKEPHFKYSNYEIWLQDRNSMRTNMIMYLFI